jgi:predicted RNase H-like HicB family nuclease
MKPITREWISKAEGDWAAANLLFRARRITNYDATCFHAQHLMHKYQITIYWSNEDQVYVAEVPELPGCMAHGDTHELALANSNEAIQLWIDTANEFGEPVPEPRGQRLMLA